MFLAETLLKKLAFNVFSWASKWKEVTGNL